VLGAAACRDERAILTDPIGDAAYGFQMQSLSTNLPRGTVRFKFHATPAAVTPDSFVVTLSGLDSLTNLYYTAWAGDSTGTTFKRITGTLSAVRTDSVLDAVGNIATTQTTVQLGTASAIQNGGTNKTYTWRFERTAAGLAASDSMVVFLLSVESSPTAATPAETRRPIWARRSEGSPSAGTATAAIRFGNFGGNPANDYLFSGTPARGRGAFWGKIFEVTDSTLTRPPQGFYYAVYLVRIVLPGATDGDTLYVGPLTSPPPRRTLSLFHSDSMITDPLVVLDNPRSILAGSARISADTVAVLPSSVPCTVVVVEGETRSCPFFGFTDVRLNLQLKDAPPRMSPWRVSGGTVPFVITSGQR
jgi:hypothetical protein